MMMFHFFIANDDDVPFLVSPPVCHALLPLSVDGFVVWSEMEMHNVDIQKVQRKTKMRMAPRPRLIFTVSGQ